LECPRESYRYDLGYWTSDFDTEVTIAATCPSSVCTQQVDQTSILVPAIATPTGIKLCEASGNILGGDLSLTASGNSWVIFDETVDVEWKIAPWTDNWVISSEAASSGSVSLKISLLQNGFALFRVNTQKTYAATDYTHLTFKIRAIPGRGTIHIGIGANNETDALNENFFGGLINNPNFKVGYPVDDTAWQLITVPLSFLGLGSGGELTNNIVALRFWPGYWDYLNTTFYLDEIVLRNYVTSFTPQAMPTDNINYGYSYSHQGPVSPNQPNNPNNNNSNGALANPSLWALQVVILAMIISVLIGVV